MCPAPRARFSLRVYSKGADEKLTDSTSDLRQTDGTAEFAQALGEPQRLRARMKSGCLHFHSFQMYGLQMQIETKSLLMRHNFG